MNRLLIGIAGGSGSGKSTLIEKLQAQFKDDVSVLHLDDYYKSNAELPLEQRQKLNYDHPKAFDMPLLAEHLKALKRGEPVESPIYDFNRFTRTAETKLIQPKHVILIEGILLLTDRKIRDLLDIKIFVDTDADVRTLRRIKRDVNQWGRTLDEAIEAYLTVVKPMHEEYVEPSKHFADLVVLEGGENQVATDMLISKIRSHLQAE